MLRNRRNTEEEVWVTWEEYKAQEEEIKRLREEIEKYKPLIEEIQRRIAEIEARLKGLEAERSRVEGELRGLLSYLEARGLRHVSPEEREAERRELRSLRAKYGRVKHYWGYYSAKARSEKDEVERLRIMIRIAPEWQKPEMEREIMRHEAEYRRWSGLAGEYAREMRLLERDIRTVTFELGRKVVSPWVFEYQARLKSIDVEIQRLMGERERMLEELRKPIPPPELVERLRRLEEEHKRKKPYRKLLAIHKRWEYRSRRRGHDIVIEAIGTAIISYGESEREWFAKVNDEIWRAIDEYFRASISWPYLAGSLEGPIVLGRQSKYTKLEPRDVKVDEMEYEHRYVAKLLNLDEVVRGYPTVEVE